MEVLESKEVQMQEQFNNQLKSRNEEERNLLLDTSNTNSRFKDFGNASWGPSDDEPLLDSTPVHLHKSTQELQIHKQNMLAGKISI